MLLLQWAAKLLLLLLQAALAARAAPSCSAAATADPVRTIVFSAVLLSPRIELVSSDHTIGTSQPTTDPARQDLFNRVQ